MRAGARVYIASRKKDACDRVASELSSIGPCISIPADVATADGRAALVEAISASEEGLHILVNNAGASWGAPYRGATRTRHSTRSSVSTSPRRSP